MQTTRTAQVLAVSPHTPTGHSHQLICTTPRLKPLSTRSKQTPQVLLRHLPRRLLQALEAAVPESPSRTVARGAWANLASPVASIRAGSCAARHGARPSTCQPEEKRRVGARRPGEAAVLPESRYGSDTRRQNALRPRGYSPSLARRRRGSVGSGVGQEHEAPVGPGAGAPAGGAAAGDVLRGGFEAREAAVRGGVTEAEATDGGGAAGTGWQSPTTPRRTGGRRGWPGTWRCRSWTTTTPAAAKDDPCPSRRSRAQGNGRS